MKITTLGIQILLRRNNQVIVPMDGDGDPKEFLFQIETERLSEFSVSQDFKMNLFEGLFNGLYLNEFFIQVFPKDYDFYLAAVNFEMAGIEYSFNYLNQFYFDNYSWRDDPFIFLSEELGRIELDIYKFDDYVSLFGMDEVNLDYSLHGGKSKR